MSKHVLESVLLYSLMNAGFLTGIRFERTLFDFGGVQYQQWADLDVVAVVWHHYLTCFSESAGTPLLDFVSAPWVKKFRIEGVTISDCKSSRPLHAQRLCILAMLVSPQLLGETDTVERHGALLHAGMAALTIICDT